MKDIMLTEEDYAFAIAKENTTLLEQVNGMLATWKEDGSLDTLINSYFDGKVTFSYENKTSTPKDGDFIMATNAAFPPFEYKKGSAFTGVDVQIAYNIAQELGKTLFVSDMEFDSIIASVKGGESDIGMAGMTVNETRLLQVNFATPYYSSAQVITVRANDTTFDNCKTAAEVEAILASKGSDYKVGTQNGTTGYMYSKGDEGFGYPGFTNITTNGYTSGALAMKDLSNGKINAVILDLQPSLLIAETTNK
jgi:polar amino acid transport system substrate-binding protein